MIETLQKEITAELLRGFIDIPRIDGYCQKCGNYGKIWGCPPYEFDRMSVWEGYSSLLLYAKRITLSEEETSREYPEEELERAYKAILDPVKRDMISELFALERDNPGSLALFPGCCEECAECARMRNEPCLKPERMRFSVESLGGDVLKILREVFGEKAEWAEKGRLPRKFILLGGVLLSDN